MPFVLWWRVCWLVLWVTSVCSKDFAFQQGHNFHSQGAETQRKTIKEHFGPLMKYIKNDKIFLAVIVFFFPLCHFYWSAFFHPIGYWTNHQSTCRDKKITFAACHNSKLFALIGILMDCFVSFIPLGAICYRLLIFWAEQEASRGGKLLDCVTI